MPIHSLLFVPAKEKMLNKLGTLEADSYIVDLEDSIEDNKKDEALLEVVTKLRNFDCNNVQIIVRVNKDRYLQEVNTLSEFNVGFMLPKFENPDEYSQIKKISDTHKIFALVETPKGIALLNENASCDYVYALAFGAEDFTASVGMINDIQYLQYQKSRMVTFARAYGKKVFDTPSFHLNDIDKFQHEVDNAKNLGFDGKMAINPKHLPYINDCFSDGDLDVIKAIVEEFEKQNQAVLVLNGKVYEKMHIAHMKKIIKENGGLK